MASKLFEGHSAKKRLKEKIRTNALHVARHIDTIRAPSKYQYSSAIECPQLETINYFEHYLAPREDYSHDRIEDLNSAETSNHSLRETVTLEDILSNFKKGHITFVGPAGSGKTTLLRSIARRAATGSCPGLQDVEFVHFMDGRTFGFQGKLTPVQLLIFDIQSDLDDIETKCYASLLKETPEKFLVILDSLDTLPFALENESAMIDFSAEAPVSTIVWNFLTGSIFPGCGIITSSREHGIRHFAGNLRPSTVIALAGLTTSSIEKISIDYLGEKRAQHTLKHFKEISPSIMKSCSTPVFLALTLHGIQNSKDFQPKSMTAVLCEVFYCLIRSSVSRVQNIEEMFMKLAHFACDGIQKGKVVFDTKELVKYGLDESDVIDLAIVAPRDEAQKLIQVENYLYFSHLCLQEILSAYHISRSDIEEFRDFLKTLLHKPRYSVIRRLLCGLLFVDDILRITEQSFGEIQWIAEKRTLLEASLKERLQQKCGAVDLLEQMITLHEGLPALRDVVSLTLQEVVLYGIALSTSDAYVIGSIISQAENLTVFAMIDCNLSAEVLNTIASRVKDGSVKVFRFQVSDNKNMGIDGILEFAEISKSCSAKYIDLGNCAMTPELLKALWSSLRDTKVAQLLLRENKNIGAEGYSILGDVVNDCGVEKLGLGGCDLNVLELRTFKIALKEATLKTLVLSSILPHTPSGSEMRVLDDMVGNVAGELRLIGWDVSRENRILLQQKMIKIQPELKIIFDEDDILTLTTPLDETNFIQTSVKKSVVAKTDIRKIGPEGGVIKIGKCEVHFRQNSVKSPTRFRVSLGMHTHQLAEENVRISSLLNCQPSMKFPVPVKIKLPIWCVTTSSDVIVHLMAQDSDDGDPYSIGSVPLKDTSGIIEFETSHFTGFWAFVKRLFFGELKFKVTPTLHFNPFSANFTTSFHVSDQIFAEICSKQLKDGGFQRCPVMLDTITLKAGDAVGTKWRCLDPKIHHFSEEDQEYFEVKEDFASDAAKHVTSILTPLPKPGQELILSCMINPYETRERKFRLVWPNEGPKDGGVHFYGDVHAGTMVLRGDAMPLHHCLQPFNHKNDTPEDMQSS